MEKMMYFFGNGVAEGASLNKELLGGKGFNLAVMSSNGVPVPAGFTIPTTYCVKYMEIKDPLMQKAWMNSLCKPIVESYKEIAEANGTDYLPLVSVRSGARVSMPGMMDTVLNVGLTESNVGEWANRIGERTAWDSYRRLMQMFGDVVYEIPKHDFEFELSLIKKTLGVESDSEIGVTDLKSLVSMYYGVYSKHDKKVPTTYEEQLLAAVEAVFRSWMNDRAVTYRNLNNLPHDWGTAVTVQSMVFGNMGDDSATGVLFTRCPSTGEKKIVGEYLVNAQGEDVVAGVRTPDKLENMAYWNEVAYDQLVDQVLALEKHAGDMQDVEFTIEKGKLYILQTRNGKRSAKASFKIVADLLKEKVISSASDALKRLSIKDYATGKQSKVSPEEADSFDMVGIAAGGGVVTGVVALDNEAAINFAAQGKKVILVAEETTPEDIAGMAASVGILTKTGGQTSHAAVVARGMNKVCVVGCSKLNMKGFKNGDKVSIDGASGKVWLKEVAILAPEDDENVKALIKKYAEKESIVIAGESLSDRVLFDIESDDIDAEITRCLCELHEDDSKVLVFPLGDYWMYPDDLSALKVADSVGMHLYDFLFSEEGIAKVLNAFQDFKGKKVLMVPQWMDVPNSILKRFGLNVVGSAGTVEQMIDGNHVVSDESVLKIFGSKKMYKMAMKAFDAAGIAVKSVPVVKTKFDILLSTMKG